MSDEAAKAKSLKQAQEGLKMVHHLYKARHRRILKNVAASQSIMAEHYQSMPAHYGFTFTPTIHHAPPSYLDATKVRLPSPCTILITGAGRGIGEAHAIAFAQADASDVILSSRTLSQLKSVKEKILAINPSIKVSTVVCDVADEAQVELLAEHVRREHGRLDVLDNNAGYLDHGWQPITDVPADEFARVFSVNDIGVFLVTRALLPLMLESEDGLKTIVETSSASAHVAGESIAMGMSKLAGARFMEYIAHSYTDQGVLTHSLMPGGVPTEMSLSDAVPGPLKEFPKARGDTAELSAWFLVWLVKERRDWLSGRYVSAEWDPKELEARKEEIVKRDLLKFQMSV